MFRTTLWSQLGEVGAHEPRAVEAFVSRYRAPLLAFVARRGQSREDSEDVVQEVFLRLFSADLLEKADQQRGRFRSYLLGITTNVLRERARRAQATKRGGGQPRVSLEALAFDPVAPNPSAPEFDACWIAHLVSRAMERVKEESPRHHELLLRVSAGEAPAAIAESLGWTPGRARVDLHRARKRLSKGLRDEVSRYCSSQEEFEAELACVLAYTQG